MRQLAPTGYAVQPPDLPHLRLAQFGAGAPQAIHTMGHGLDMAGIHTSAVATKVVGLQPFRNRPDKHFVSKAMAANQPPRTILQASNAKGSITLLARPRPLPAPILAGVDLTPEAVNQCGPKWSWVTRPKPTHVVHETPSTNAGQTATVGDDTLKSHREHSILVAVQPVVICHAAASIILEAGRV